MENPVCFNFIFSDVDSSKIKSLPFQNKIHVKLEELETIRMKWRPYIEHNMDFHRLIRKMNYYDGLKYKLEEQFNIYDATNNWLNMYEVLFRIKNQFINSKTIDIIFHIDLPSDCIRAAEYFFNKNKQKYAWVCTTHKCYMTDELYNDKVYKRNIDKWITSNDIKDVILKDTECESSSRSHPSIVNFVSQKIISIKNKSHQKFNIYISHMNFTDNEYKNVLDNYIQFVVGLDSIKEEGMLIIRSRDIHLPFNIWLIDTISRLFKSVQLLKPMTMRSYESELYIICHSFKGISNNDLDKLYYILSTFKRKYVNKILSEVKIDTIQHIYKCVFELMDYEISIKTKYMKLVESELNKQKIYLDIEKKTTEVLDNFVYGFDINI